MNEMEARALLRSMLHQPVVTEILPHDIPEEVREAVQSELDIWRPAPANRLASIRYWHWQPTFEVENGEPTIIAQKFEWIVDSVADSLIMHFKCARKVALKAAIKLVETEAGGPIRPPGGARKFLEDWLAANE